MVKCLKGADVSTFETLDNGFMQKIVRTSIIMVR